MKTGNPAGDTTDTAPENRGFRYRERIGLRHRGAPVAEYLAARHPHSTLAVWQDRIREGRVSVDGLPATLDTRLDPGQELVWHRPPWREPEAPLDFRVLHLDPDLVAVDKPAGLPTLPGAGFLENTLLFQVRRKFPEASAVHRLGRWTSGVVLFARTPRGRARLSLALRRRELEKTYLALGTGSPARERWVVETGIGKRPHRHLGFVYAAHPGGVPARTEVEVLERTGSAFLARVVIRTGRPHQIRIHLAASGHPLQGDPLYPGGGVPSPETEALPGDPGYRLHASRVEGPHPAEGELRISAPDPVWVRGLRR